MLASVPLPYADESAAELEHARLAVTQDSQEPRLGERELMAVADLTEEILDRE